MTTDAAGLPISVGVLDKQKAALAYAADEADRIGCDVRVVHAYTVPPEPPTVLSAAFGVDIDALFRGVGDDVLAEAADFVSATHPDVSIHRVLERGPAPQVLLEQSRTSRLIVLGPDESRPWYVRLFESRVARRLANDSSCPVVVVPDTWVATSQPSGVTLMLDAETTAHGPLRHAFETADHTGANLLIVHVEPPEGPRANALAWHDMTRLIDSWQGIFPRVQVETRTMTGLADVDRARSLEATGLLVLGRPRETSPIPGMSRSLARAVIEHAECPVAVVPPRYKV